MLFFYLVVSFMTILILLTNNMYLHFIFLMIISLNFMFLMTVSNQSSVLYFTIQEYFNLLMGIMIYYEQKELVILFLLIKVGTPPFWQWVLSLSKDMSGKTLNFFLSVQKMPFLFVIIPLISTKWFWVISFGLFLSLCSMISISNEISMFVTSSSGSVSWFLLISMFDELEGIFTMLVYIITFWILIPVSFKSSMKISALTMLILMSLPNTVLFFMKVMICMSSYLMIMVLIVLTSMSILVYLKVLWSSMSFNYLNFSDGKYLLLSVLLQSSSLLVTL